MVSFAVFEELPSIILELAIFAKMDTWLFSRGIVFIFSFSFRGSFVKWNFSHEDMSLTFFHLWRIRNRFSLVYNRIFAF